ncbi:hypothetical protein [Candidatus Palauibacter sp.]|uniref:hypothetical protein n=1 Tax=Candidatus Palauibacter sp. TaxID=3101350 RepID=UPI003B5A2C86
MPTVLVLDTSYLCELYRVPGFHRSELPAQIEERIRMRGEDRFYVPLGCLYELCDHIGDVADGGRRHEIAGQIVSDVETSLEDGLPWLIIPAADVEAELPGLLRRFSEDPAHLEMGLTDSTVISKANRLREKYSTSLGYRVHIWTTDRTLKAYEPDREPEPLL